MGSISGVTWISQDIWISLKHKKRAECNFMYLFICYLHNNRQLIRVFNTDERHSVNKEFWFISKEVI